MPKYLGHSYGNPELRSGLWLQPGPDWGVTWKMGEVSVSVLFRSVNTPLVCTCHYPEVELRELGRSAGCVFGVESTSFLAFDGTFLGTSPQMCFFSVTDPPYTWRVTEDG